MMILLGGGILVLAVIGLIIFGIVRLVSGGSRRRGYRTKQWGDGGEERNLGDLFQAENHAGRPGLPGDSDP